MQLSLGFKLSTVLAPRPLFLSCFTIFTESAHWADSVIESRCPDVCMCVTIQNTLFRRSWRLLVFWILPIGGVASGRDCFYRLRCRLVSPSVDLILKPQPSVKQRSTYQESTMEVRSGMSSLRASLPVDWSLPDKTNTCLIEQKQIHAISSDC